MTVFNDPFCSQILSGTLIADRVNNKLLLGTPQQLGRASLHFSDGHSHTSASLLGKFAGQCLWCCSQGNRKSLSWNSHSDGTPTMAVSYAFSRANEIAHHCLVRDYRSAAWTSKELLGPSDHEVHGVRAFLHCDVRASLHDCCSVSVMLDSRAM